MIPDCDSESYADSGVGSRSDTDVSSIRNRLRIVTWVTGDLLTKSNSESDSLSDSDLDSVSDTDSNPYWDSNLKSAVEPLHPTQ